MTWIDDTNQQQHKTFATIANGHCPCISCLEASNLSTMHFITCPKCGNKRCPHANNHLNPCTNSNEPGQKGSAYD
jgi:hypothetical protein